MLELEADHRRHAEIENAIRDLKYVKRRASGNCTVKAPTPRATSCDTPGPLGDPTLPAGSDNAAPTNPRQARIIAPVTPSHGRPPKSTPHRPPTIKGVPMTQRLVLGPPAGPLAPLANRLPPMIAGTDDRTAWRFVDFFAVTTRNPNTREAYYRAVSRFMDWCEMRGIHRLDSN